MKITPSIIRALIQEEISRTLIQEVSTQEAIGSLQNSLSRLMGELDYQDPDQLDAIFQQAKQNLKQDNAPANRDDIRNEGCGDMQSIDMGVKHDEGDHEGSMAKRQMFKTAEYAADIFDMIEDGQEFPAWIQSKMTKIADYIGAVKHYLEYDEVMDVPGNRKEKKKWSDADHEKQEKIAKEIEKENPGISKQKKMAFAGAQVNREKRKRNK